MLKIRRVGRNEKRKKSLINKKERSMKNNNTKTRGLFSTLVRERERDQGENISEREKRLKTIAFDVHSYLFVSPGTMNATSIFAIICACLLLMVNLQIDVIPSIFICSHSFRSRSVELNKKLMLFKLEFYPRHWLRSTLTTMEF